MLFLPQVEPGTRFCNFSPNCRNAKVTIDARALGRLPPPTPPLSVRSAGPSTLLTVGLPLLALATLLAVAAGLLFLRRKHRRALGGFMATSQENGGFGLELSGPRVLLLHLARSDAERAALRQLTAELRLRGASVVDSDAPEWRRAARRDAAALASAVAAADRVLLLSSSALAAAVAAGGGGEPERLVAAAARQVSAGRLTVDYGRLYQARLAADAPTLDSLVPGAAYTLPEHQRELVTALLAGTNRTKPASDSAATDTILTSN
ncbi:hypothetical protein FJT64_027797 [Amphibalanus amphitrite]|uniref:SEFIR domain-containing protein n=1 Tax=Amphibalanus amphitrite TaxID=1232801 RepID=A0A6A4WBY0_AMPAM|nr:hypothetical protein FJT64_027797 [Amphibalanus amphitrite]